MIEIIIIVIIIIIIAIIIIIIMIMASFVLTLGNLPQFINICLYLEIIS